MIVITRFEVPEGETEDFLVRAEAAVAVLRRREGLRSLDLARNLDEPDLLVRLHEQVDRYLASRATLAERLTALRARAEQPD